MSKNYEKKEVEVNLNFDDDEESMEQSLKQ
jgi:hypothetical protein